MTNEGGTHESRTTDVIAPQPITGHQIHISQDEVVDLDLNMVDSSDRFTRYTHL